MSEGISKPAATVDLLVLYDGVCGFCNGMVRYLLKIDREGRVFYAPLQGETASRIRARHHDITDSLDSIVLVKGFDSPAESVLLASDAVLTVLGELGGRWRLLSGLRVIPVRIRDFIYGFIAANRYRWFGKYETCPIPDSTVQDRFLP
jgi:predicted DCC family thiol-disulfide oxidoreductase YuxK